jgi:hypothetical protein
MKALQNPGKSPPIGRPLKFKTKPQRKWRIAENCRFFCAA